MTYRRTLLQRWSRQDWGAILVIALAVAFLTGTALIVDATATRTTDIAATQPNPANITWYDSTESATQEAESDALVLPVAHATVDGERVTVVGLPPETAGFANETDVSLSSPPAADTVRQGSTTETVRLNGATGVVTARTQPANESILPRSWYQAHPTTVDELGTTGALVVDPTDGATPLQGALPFFVTGARGALQLVGLVTVGAGLLLGVVVFGVTRVTVRDRRQAIRIIRATGGTTRQVLGVFAVRAGLQTALGVAIGYAVGIILTNIAVSVAVFAGRPVALAPQVSLRVVAILIPAYLGLVGVGTLSGALATRPFVRVPPAASKTVPSTPVSASTSHLARIRPTLLGWRAVLPTAVTLGVFLVFVIVAVSTYGVVMPLADTGGGTITEPGATHTLSSEVPVAYASTLRDRGIEASPELLLLGVQDGQPYVARGANYTAFADLSSARVVRGTPPTRQREAVVGTDLARTLAVAPGDTLTLGGSTSPSVTRVRVTGVYEATEPYDDQLVVPLETGQHLSGRQPGTAHMIRVGTVPETTAAVSVLAIDAPAQVPADDTAKINVTVVNPTPANASRTVTVQFGPQRYERSVTLAAGQQRTVSTNVSTGRVRTVQLTVANRTRQVEVVASETLQFTAVPEQAPQGSTPRVRVETIAGNPVADAVVTTGAETKRTDADGWVRIPLSETGQVQLRAQRGERETETTVAVTATASHRLRGSLSVTPRRPTSLTQPTARATLSNPWNRTVTRTVSVVGPSETATTTVGLAPGEERTLEASLGRQPPGQYTVSVESNSTTVPLASTTYRVSGDARLSASLASTGRDGPSTGFGQAARTIFGNLELVVAVLLLLVALMTVGATTSAFAGAVDNRAQTLGIHRAVGASPVVVYRLVLSDALRIGTMATLIGLALAGAGIWLLDVAGLLTVYGIRLLSAISPAVVVLAGVSGLCLAVLGAMGATWRVVRVMPAQLLTTDE